MKTLVKRSGASGVGGASAGTRAPVAGTVLSGLKKKASPKSEKKIRQVQKGPGGISTNFQGGYPLAVSGEKDLGARL